MSDHTAVSIGSADELTQAEIAMKIARANRLGIDTTNNFDAKEKRKLTAAEEALKEFNDATKTTAELLAEPPTKWVIRDLIKENQFGILNGMWKAGKTMAAIHIANCVARGIPIISKVGEEPFGEVVEPCSVAYIVIEGQGEIRDRVDAWNIEHDPQSRLLDASPHKVYWMRKKPDFFDDAHLESFKVYCAQRKVKFFIVDTLSASLEGSGVDNPENNNPLMTKIMNRLESVALTLGGFGFFVSHPPKSDPEGTRGGGAIVAAARFVIQINDEGDGTRSIRLSKTNAAAEGEKQKFEIGSVQVGVDDKGRPLDAGVFRYAGKSNKPIIHLSNQKQASLIALNGAVDGDGEIDRGTATEVLKGIKVAQPRSVLNALQKEGLIEGVGRKGQTWGRYKLTEKGRFKAGFATMGEPLGNRLRTTEDEMARFKERNGADPSTPLT
jgi:hypothetical protein